MNFYFATRAARLKYRSFFLTGDRERSQLIKQNRRAACVRTLGGATGNWSRESRECDGRILAVCCFAKEWFICRMDVRTLTYYEHSNRINRIL